MCLSKNSHVHDGRKNQKLRIIVETVKIADLCGAAWKQDHDYVSEYRGCKKSALAQVVK